MFSFGAKNILWQNTTTQDVFLSDNQNIIDYLPKTKPQFSYRNLPAYEVTAKRRNDQHSPLEIKDCMTQQEMIYESAKSKEYLRDCDPCRGLEFGSCENS